MGATLWLADKDVHRLAESVREEFHQQLHAAEVSIAVVFTMNAEKDGEPKPAIKKMGHPVPASVRVTSVRDRVLGVPDIVITIDASQWTELSQEQRIALLDHQLSRVELASEDVDQCDRPKLKLRPYDWLMGGFNAVVERHGANSVECADIAGVLSEGSPVRQLMLHWG